MQGWGRVSPISGETGKELKIKRLEVKPEDDGTSGSAGRMSSFGNRNLILSSFVDTDSGMDNQSFV
jgi:hypothetical protein